VTVTLATPLELVIPVINEEKKQEKRGKNTMTEERLNPLTWLQSKFAQLTHTHTKTDITNLETVVTSWSNTVSNNNIPTEKLTKDTLDTKISKSQTTGLVKNDGTIDTTTYSTFSGSYTDLSNKPSIPASSSDLSDGTSLVKTSNTAGLLKNDGSVMTSGTGSTNYSAGNHTHSGYISTSSTTGLVKNDGSIMTSGTGSSNWAVGNHTHSGYVSGTKVTSWSSTVSDSNIPSEKLVKDYIDNQIGTAIQYIQQ